MHDSIISFFGFFKIVNFLFLIGFFIYFFRKKVVPSLDLKQRQEKEYKATLTNEYLSLRKERAEVLKALSLQDQQGKILLYRTQLWYDQVKKQVEIQNRERQATQELVKKYFELQSQKAVNEQLKKTLSQEVLCGLKNILIQQMESEQLHQECIEYALNKLKETVL